MPRQIAFSVLHPKFCYRVNPDRLTPQPGGAHTHPLGAYAGGDRPCDMLVTGSRSQNAHRCLNSKHGSCREVRACFHIHVFSQRMTTRTSTKPRKPAEITLLDVIELYVQARVQQVIESTQSLSGKRATQLHQRSVTKASLRSSSAVEVKPLACEHPTQPRSLQRLECLD